MGIDNQSIETAHIKQFYVFNLIFNCIVSFVLIKDTQD